MKCASFDPVGLALDVLPAGEVRDSLAHAAGCPACARRYAAEQAVETRLRAALSAPTQTVRVSATPWPWAVAAAAAAAVFLVWPSAQAPRTATQRARAVVATEPATASRTVRPRTRDPFLPLVDPVVVVEAPPAPQTLTQMRLIAIVSGTAVPRAMLEGADGMGHVVREGEVVDGGHYRVARITRNEVVFEPLTGGEALRKVLHGSAPPSPRN